MKELTIGRNDAGQRLDRFLAKAVPLLPASLAQKYIRLKRIKCNNARAQRDTRLQEGDVLQLYINDEFFDKPSEANAYLTVTAPKLNIVYEDENLIACNNRGVPMAFKRSTITSQCYTVIAQRLLGEKAALPKFKEKNIIQKLFG